MPLVELPRFGMQNIYKEAKRVPLKGSRRGLKYEGIEVSRKQSGKIPLIVQTSIYCIVGPATWPKELQSECPFQPDGRTLR